MYNEVIALGKPEIVEDKYGNQSKEYVFKEVFAEVKSVSQSEYYTAAQSGFKPVFKFILADYYDYEEEDTVIYNGILYHIIRTYRNGLQLELTVEKKVEGVTNE